MVLGIILATLLLAVTDTGRTMSYSSSHWPCTSIWMQSVSRSWQNSACQHVISYTALSFSSEHIITLKHAVPITATSVKKTAWATELQIQWRRQTAAQCDRPSRASPAHSFFKVLQQQWIAVCRHKDVAVCGRLLWWDSGYFPTVGHTQTGFTHTAHTQILYLGYWENWNIDLNVT